MLSHRSFIRVHKNKLMLRNNRFLFSFNRCQSFQSSSKTPHGSQTTNLFKWSYCKKKHFGFGATCRPYMYYMPKTFDSFSWNWFKNICPLRGFSFLFFETNMLVPSTYHYTQTWRVKLLFVSLYLFNKCRVQIASKYSNRDYLFFQKRWKKTYGRL